MNNAPPSTSLPMRPSIPCEASADSTTGTEVPRYRGLPFGSRIASSTSYWLHVCATPAVEGVKIDVVPVTGTWSLAIAAGSMAVHDAPVSK